MRIGPAASALLLAACSAPAEEAVPQQTTEAESTATPLPRPQQAEAIHVSEETDRIDFELTVPAEAAALPRLKAKLIREADEAKTATLAEQATYAKDTPDAGSLTYGMQHNWRVVGQTDRLLALVLDVTGYTGGAHPSAGTRPLIWDREADRMVPLSALFTDKAKALATIRPAYCQALAAARLEKRGMVLGEESGFAECPPFDDLTVVPAGNVNGKFSRVLVIADPYVAGPWAEGSYEIELVIPKNMIPFVAMDYRASLPG